MSDIIRRQEQLPADFGDSLMKGIDQTRSGIVVGGGKPFLRLSRSGDYIFGPQNSETQPGAHWAVNLATLEHGWVCWGDGELLGQVMGSVQLPAPARPLPVDGIAFEAQFGMDIVCVFGDDKGLELNYKNNSLGFKKAYDQLLADVRTRYAADQIYYWPIIELDTSSYTHKKYGQIYEPVFKLVAWASAAGEIQKAGPRAVPEAAKAAAPATSVPASPKRKRAPAAAPAEDTAGRLEQEASYAAAREAAPEPEPAPAPTGQRRRPAAR